MILSVTSKTYLYRKENMKQSYYFIFFIIPIVFSSDRSIVQGTELKKKEYTSKTEITKLN